MILSVLKLLIRSIASRMGFVIYRTSALPRCTDIAADIRRCGIDLTHAVIVDVGANEGQMATYFRHSYPESTIICCEPFPKAFEACESRFASDASAKCLKLALSNQPGEGRLFLARDSQLNSLKAQVNAEDFGFVPVQVDTLDNLCKKLSLAKVDILKIDTEGSDLDVLTGGSQIFALDKVGLVLAECAFDRADKRHTYFFDLCHFLECRGFRFLGLYNARQSNRRLYFCDALFISQKYPFACLC